MKNNVKELLKPVVVLTLIAAVMAGLLGGTNLLTAERIATLTAKAETEAVSKVIKAESYEKKKVTTDTGDYTYYEALKNGTIVGYAFAASHNGYGGAVSIVIGVNTLGGVTAVEITDVSNETPGLGQNAKKTSFTDQFKDKTEIGEVKKTGAKGNDINAVTGATITSRAVANAVNSALELYDAVKEGDK